MTSDTEILGIDLGTTNSTISIWDPKQKQAITIPNQEGKELTPSVVTFDLISRAPIVGDTAVEMMLTNPEDVIYSVKRYIGLSYQSAQVRLSKDQVTYRIESTPQDKVLIRAADRSLSPSQVSKYVLEKLKNDAEIFLKRPIKDVVITVPAYFTESQRHATIDAGRRAGLKVQRLVNEPTAAALAFDLDPEPQTVVIYDLGGGTFDVSIIEIKKGMYRVVATSGDNHLGGDDFDENVVNWIKEQVSDEYGVSLAMDSHQEALLREKAEQAKIALSDKTETTIKLSELRVMEGDPLDVALTISRDTFETLVQPLIEETLKICDKTLTMAKKKTGILAKGIKEVLLVGGQTLTPGVRNALHERYGWKINSSMDACSVVGLGAAVLGGYLNNDAYLKKKMRLWDVIAQPLGIEVKGGEMKELIKANQQIPYSTRRTPEEYTTHQDGQKRIEFRVYQGMDSIAKNNTHLGTINLPLTRPLPTGEARVKCWFEIDWDGILKVHAKELDTDAEEVVQTIDYFYFLSHENADEIERPLKDTVKQ